MKRRLPAASSCALLLVACSASPGSASNGSEISATPDKPDPSAAGPGDADIRRKLLVCGAAYATPPSTPTGAADKMFDTTPLECRGLGLTDDDFRALATYKLHVVALDPPVAASSSPRQLGPYKIDISAAPGCKPTLADRTAFDLGGPNGGEADKFLARAKHDVSSETKILINADSAATHGCVVHVIDILKQAGATKIAFGVTPTSP